jgi:hypothetical protein
VLSLQSQFFLSLTRRPETIQAKTA